LSVAIGEYLSDGVAEGEQRIFCFIQFAASGFEGAENCRGRILVEVVGTAGGEDADRCSYRCAAQSA
jgi:hypothetical protein